MTETIVQSMIVLVSVFLGFVMGFASASKKKAE